MTEEIRDKLIEWAGKYNDPAYFQEDPIAFPREFVRRGASLQDIEIAALFSAHFAWGRRAMIVRDCERLFNEMQWKPLQYVMAGDWRSDDTSIHRTVKWSEVAGICRRLKDFYTAHNSMESLEASRMRTEIFAQKESPTAPAKKINMMRRWMVRNDGKVDLGLWKNISPASLIIPLDIHVYEEASALGLLTRHQKDLKAAVEITDSFREIFPNDPCLGDFALFGYGVTK